MAKVLAAVAVEDWDKAIKLAAKVTTMGKYAEVISRGSSAISNPDLYRQMGKDPAKLRADAIVALKERIAAADGP